MTRKNVNRRLFTDDDTAAPATPIRATPAARTKRSRPDPHSSPSATTGPTTGYRPAKECYAPARRGRYVVDSDSDDDYVESNPLAVTSPLDEYGSNFSVNVRMSPYSSPLKKLTITFEN